MLINCDVLVYFTEKVYLFQFYFIVKLPQICFHHIPLNLKVQNIFVKHLFLLKSNKNKGFQSKIYSEIFTGQFCVDFLEFTLNK